MKYEKRREESNKLENTLLAAAGVIVGGTLLHKSGGTKFISKAIGDISHTMKKISNDISLVGRKGLTAEKTSELFKKHISNSDSTWKLKRNDKTYTIKTNKGLFGDLNKLSNLNSVFNSINSANEDMELNRYAFNKLANKFKNIKDRDQAFMKDLYTLTERALNKKNKFFEQSSEPGKYIPLIKEFKKYTKGNLLEGKEEEIADVLKEALNNADKIKENAKRLSSQAQDDFKNIYEQHIKEKYKAKKTTGDRPATVKDIYEALQQDKVKVAKESKEAQEEFINQLKSLLKKDKSFEDLIVDAKTYRIDKDNQFYTLEDLRETSRKAQEEFSETIAGKLFATKNIIEAKKSPDIFHFPAGTFDPGLAKILGGKDLLKEEVIYIGDKFYKASEYGLEHLKEADGRLLKSGRQGTIFGYLDRISGNAAQRNQQNEFFKFLDINTKGGEAFDEFKSIFTKFSSKSDNDWGRSITNRLFNKYSYDNPTIDNIRDFSEDIISLSQIYNENTRSVNKKTIDILENILNDKSKVFLEAIKKDDPLEYIADIKEFKNQDLKSLLNKISNNEELKDTMTRATKNSVIKYQDILERELLKEALLQDSFNSKGISGYATTLSKLEDSAINKSDINNLKDLFNWGIIQSQSKTFVKDIYTPKSIEEKTDAYLNLTKMFNGKNSNSQEDYFLKESKESIISFVNDNTSLKDKIDINKNNQLGYTRPQWITTKQNISPLDIIKSINDETKNTKETIESFAKQFVAGRNNIEDVSTLTMIPYHLVNRLVTPLEHIGLGFSNASTSSAFDISKNLLLKRVLPAAGLLYGASYLNYEMENLTGTSFSEAYYNAIANFNVGLRVLGSPFDKYLDRQREFNPIANYWLGDHKDKEEYLDYLEYGYDPVRKGRFWSFGSASEFRGGKISYFEPNKLRQAHSNYRDIAIYGSSEEKWKHSIVPTLRHPFSTIRYLSNPYWLEEKHYEDRPYPVTGKMFSEGTPWGAILNPTIGELIKPQKRMHQEHLQGTALDVRNIIKQRNDEIKEKSQENRLIRIDESGLTPMMFTPESMPSMNEAIYNIKIDNGKITSAGYLGQQYAESIDSFNTADYAPVSTNDSIVANTSLNYGILRLNTTNDYDNKHAASWISGIAALTTSGAIKGDTAIKMIEQVNNSIKYRSESTNRGQWFEKGRLHTNPSYNATQKAKLSYTEQMIDMNTKADYVHDMIYSAKQLSGMYGFLFDQVVDTPKAYRLEHAGKISSFSRQFWDESVGGLGGNIMEIARRFFPHEDHNVENINPIRNTMEEWLPARFLEGDPYTKVTKGEARLPGPGYEALNKLHSDKYGRYGSLDRMKILGDVAPLSEEYKIWKKIAKEENKDSASKKEIAAIEERVKQQTKEHDFYNYKFLGKKMTNQKAIIDEVSNTGKFKIIGSNQEFSLAGIKPVNNEEGKSYVHDYLKPGMIVNLQYENNNYNNKDSEGRISAIVKHNYSNINSDMYYDGTAKEKDTKETLADERYKLTEMNSITGPIWEAIGHAPIPFIHNKFMRINSSLETYKHEQVYGTSYSTWDHPIKGFIKPAFQESIASNPVHQLLGIGAFALSEYAKDNISNKTVKTAIDTAFGLITPGAFAGGMIASIPKMKIIKSDENKIWNTRNGARLGTAITLTGYALTNTQNPLLTSTNFALAGIALQEQFKFKGHSKASTALIGAGVGLAISGLNPESKLYNLSKKWIPEDTEKKWEIEEYFDRLEYIKYMNLYNKAAKEAKRKEHVDVKSIVNKYERNKEKNEEKIKKLEEQKIKAEKMIDEKAKKKLISEIDYKINELLTPIQYLKAGEYTKSAIAYKKAADTTIYGLTKDATTADVLRSLPKYDRDFFLDFANENDPKKRKKILEYVSPYKAKALKIMWGEEVDKTESNENFFNNHNLPNMFWSGWQPQIDLEHVKMKTIENEGMLLSDFGMYDSNKNEPAAINAPEIRDIHKAPNPLSLQTNLLSLMNGVGFSNVDVSVEPTNKPGIQMLVNMSRVASFNINNSVSSVLNKLLL